MMRIIASLNKGDAARFVSHLDIQRVLHRTIARANIPISYSQGFNPHPLVSFAAALSVGFTGENEWIDIKLDNDINVSEFISRMNAEFPVGFSINAARMVDKSYPSLSAIMHSADYELIAAHTLNRQSLENAISSLLDAAITITKHKKQGNRIVDAQVDIRPSIRSVDVVDCQVNHIAINVCGRLDASGGLPIGAFAEALNKQLDTKLLWRINRKTIHLEDEF